MKRDKEDKDADLGKVGFLGANNMKAGKQTHGRQNKDICESLFCGGNSSRYQRDQKSKTAAGKRR